MTKIDFTEITEHERINARFHLNKAQEALLLSGWVSPYEPDTTKVFEIANNHLAKAFSLMGIVAVPKAEVAPKAEWKPLSEGGPDNDVFHFRGLWVNQANGEVVWEQFFGCVDDTLGEFVGPDGNDFGWNADTYTHWLDGFTVPMPPEAPETPE